MGDGAKKTIRGRIGIIVRDHFLQVDIAQTGLDHKAG
jgi:hypothetical protein